MPWVKVSLLHGVDGSCFVKGELDKIGWNAADGTIVCSGDVTCSDQSGSSLVVAEACTISSIPKSDLDSGGFMLMLCEYGLYPWQIFD